MSSPTSSSLPPAPTPSSQEPESLAIKILKAKHIKPPKSKPGMPPAYSFPTPSPAPEWLKPIHAPTAHPPLVFGPNAIPDYTYPTPSKSPPAQPHFTVDSYLQYSYLHGPPQTYSVQPLPRELRPSRLPTKADFLKTCVTLAKEGDKYNDNKCAFCWGVYDVAHPGVRIEPCGHVFGAACLERIVEGENVCPKCRVELFERERGSK